MRWSNVLHKESREEVLQVSCLILLQHDLPKEGLESTQTKVHRCQTYTGGYQ